MDEKELLRLLMELRKRLPEVYRHVVGLIRAALHPASS